MPGSEALERLTVAELRRELQARGAGTAPTAALRDFSVDRLVGALLDKEREAFGTHEAVDLYQVSDPLILQDADSVVALFDQDDVPAEDAEFAALRTRPFGTAYNLCSSERFLKQPTGAFAAGCLVGPDLILTAGKSIDPASLGRVRFVFGFRMQDDRTPVTEVRVRRSEVYQGIDIVGREVNEAGADWALVRLDRPVSGHRIARVRLTGKVGDTQELHVIGHPAGLPAKVAGGATVRENTAPGFFTANLAAYGGDIGSPVFNSQTHEVEGILVRGETAFVANGSCQVVLVCPSTGCRGSDCTRATEFSQSVPHWYGWDWSGGVCLTATTAQSRPTDDLHAWVRGVDGAAWHWWAGPLGSPLNARWARYGGIGQSAPVGVLRGGEDGFPDLFMVGADGMLYHRPAGNWSWTGTSRLAGAWEGWERLDGWCSSPPAICSWGAKHLDAFVLGTDHAVWHRAWDGAVWSRWESLGGVFSTPPCVCSWGVNRLDLFALGMEHDLNHQAWDGTAWGGWQSLGGAFSSPPAVVSRGPKLLDVFVLGTDTALHYQTWDGAGWSGWRSLGGNWSSAPSAASWGVNRLDVVVLDADSVVNHRFWDGTKWYDWERLDGLTCSSPPVATSRGVNRLEVLVLGTDSALYHQTWS
jgi:hypothetical protein